MSRSGKNLSSRVGYLSCGDISEHKVTRHAAAGLCDRDSAFEAALDVTLCDAKNFGIMVIIGSTASDIHGENQ